MCCNGKFYLCSHCGNMAVLVIESGAPLVCCGDKMTELVPNTVEASVEKHVPAVTVSGDTVSVQVGSVAHPMEEAHHISFVYVVTESGSQCKCLEVGKAPSVTFNVAGDKAVAVYAHCNLHGLWKADV